MKSRERVRRAITFENPDRVPLDLVVLASTMLERADEVEAMVKRYPLDIELPEFTYGPGFESGSRTEVGIYYDEWGCPFEVLQAGLKGEVKEAILTDWSFLGTIQPPFDFLENADFSQVDLQCQQSDKFILAKTKVRPFERLQFLRGTENVMIDLALGSSELKTLLSMIHDFYRREIELWTETAVDAIFFQDDWGAQNNMLISPRMWREHFKPIYQDFASLIRKAGKFVFFHSDGYIQPIIPDLIEIGVDALNAQLFCMDIEQLGDQFRGEITFWGEIDRQSILPFGTPQDVESAVQRVRSALETKEGGVIAWCEWGNDVSGENIEAFFKAWA